MSQTTVHKDIHFELVEALRRGERSAQFEIYNLYAKAMLNTSYRIVKDLSLAEDVVQESFIKAFNRIDRFRGDAAFGSWLKKIVINGALSALKKLKDFEPIEKGHEDFKEEELPVDSDLSINQIKEAVYKLPDGFRLVFSLYLFEGYDHKEISEILGVTESTSKSQFNRAKGKLRELLKEMYGYER